MRHLNSFQFDHLEDASRRADPSFVSPPFLLALPPPPLPRPQAAGTAATRLRDGRSGVARSGVIPALASIAAAYQERPASDRGSGKSDGDGDGDAAMADADADADAAAGPVPVPVLTPAHPELLQCCLLAGHCRAAARLAGTVPVRTVDGTGTAGAVGAPPPGPPPARTRPAALPGVTSDTYLRYFYYLGRVRVGCDDVVGALAAFSVCLSAPAHLVSAVAVAARKKMVLCRCLASPPLSGPLGVGADADSDRMRRARAKLRRDITSVPPSVSPFVAEYIGSASGGTAAASLSGGGGGRGGGGGGGEAITSAKRSRGYDNDGNDVVMEGGEGTTGGGAEGSGERSQQQQRGGDDGGETKMAVEVEVEVEMEEPELSAGMPPEDADRSQPQQPPVSDRFRRDMNHHNLGRYEMLADAFASSDRVAFRSLREGMTDLLRLDGNASLAERVEQWMNTRAVYAVAAVYEVASLSDVANEMGLEGGAAEAERMVRDAVAASSLSPSAPHLSARIDQESGMVSFDAHADVYGDESDDDDDDDGTYRTGLASQMRQCFELAERIRLLDTQVTTSGKYQDILARKERNAKNASQVGDGGKNSAGPRGVADLGGFDDENTE